MQESLNTSFNQLKEVLACTGQYVFSMVPPFLFLLYDNEQQQHKSTSFLLSLFNFLRCCSVNLLSGAFKGFCGPHSPLSNSLLQTLHATPYPHISLAYSNSSVWLQRRLAFISSLLLASLVLSAVSSPLLSVFHSICCDKWL